MTPRGSHKHKGPVPPTDQAFIFRALLPTLTGKNVCYMTAQNAYRRPNCMTRGFVNR